MSILKYVCIIEVIFKGGVELIAKKLKQNVHLSTQIEQYRHQTTLIDPNI